MPVESVISLWGFYVCSVGYKVYIVEDPYLLSHE